MWDRAIPLFERALAAQKPGSAPNIRTLYSPGTISPRRIRQSVRSTGRSRSWSRHWRPVRPNSGADPPQHFLDAEQPRVGLPGRWPNRPGDRSLRADAEGPCQQTRDRSPQYADQPLRSCERLPGDGRSHPGRVIASRRPHRTQKEARHPTPRCCPNPGRAGSEPIEATKMGRGRAFVPGRSVDLGRETPR